RTAPAPPHRRTPRATAPAARDSCSRAVAAARRHASSRVARATIAPSIARYLRRAMVPTFRRLMQRPLLTTDLPFAKRIGHGKVRDLYELGGDLLLVTTDR